MKRDTTWLAALGAAALALVCQSGVAGLVDPDGFAHLAWARHGRPLLPLTILGQSNVDLWLGFHWLMKPFTLFSDLWGARVAGACIAAASALGLAAALRRLGARWVFALAPWGMSFVFAERACNARPAQLTIPLLLAELLAGAGLAHPAWALLAAFAHGLLHVSSPLSPLFALAGCLAARKSGSARAVLWSVGGLSLALLARPDRALYPAFAALASGTALSARLPHTGGELLSGGPAVFLLETWPGLALLAFALWQSRGEDWRTPQRAAALAGAALGCALCLANLRFVDYCAPLLALAAGAFWRRRAAWLAPLALLFALHVPEVWRQGNAFIDGPETYARIAAQVRARVPPGAMIFTDDPFVTEVLLSALPEYRYLDAFDPAMLWLASPAHFSAWARAIAGEIDPARALRDFDTRWAITSAPRGRRTMQESMARDARRFAFVDAAPGSAGGLYFFELRATASR